MHPKHIEQGPSYHGYAARRVVYLTQWNVAESWRIIVYYILTILHTILSFYSFRMELALLGLLAVGWILGRTSAEYAEILKRPNSGWILLTGLCGPRTVLLNLSLIADCIWFHSYAKLPIAAGWLLATLAVGAVCQRLAQHSALQILLANGYERPYPAILPKQRGS